jgi:hypothetical protein
VTTCDLCGFVYESVPVDALGGIVRGLGPRYREVLLGPAGDGPVDERTARIRLEPEVWSVLEYACHMRDVLLVQRDRAIAALVDVRPTFSPMYRDERVELAHYASQGVETVTAQIDMAASLFALVFDGLGEAQLRRPLVYQFPQVAERDVAWLGRHTVHEGEHHLLDITSVRSRVDAAR